MQKKVIYLVIACHNCNPYFWERKYFIHHFICFNNKCYANLRLHIMVVVCITPQVYKLMWYWTGLAKVFISLHLCLFACPQSQFKVCFLSDSMKTYGNCLSCATNVCVPPLYTTNVCRCLMPTACLISCDICYENMTSHDSAGKQPTN